MKSRLGGIFFCSIRIHSVVYRQCAKLHGNSFRTVYCLPEASSSPGFKPAYARTMKNTVTHQAIAAAFNITTVTAYAEDMYRDAWYALTFSNQIRIRGDLIRAIV